MLYQWKFSVIDKDRNVLRQDDIIAPTAADADFLYKHNVQSWTYDERQIFSYESDPQPNKLFTGETFIVGSHTLLNKIQIDCLGEVEVKLKTESPIPVIDASEKLLYDQSIPLLIRSDKFEAIHKSLSHRDILGSYLYSYKTPGGKIWNLWPDTNGWQVVYYGCTSVTTIYSANDFYELYEKIEGKPFPLNPQIPGHRSIDNDGDDPGFMPRSTNRATGGRF